MNTRLIGNNTSTTPALKLVIGFFLIVAITHLVIHCFLPNYIFDDTRHIAASYAESLQQQGHSTPQANDIIDIIKEEFTNDSTREYRPLSFVQSNIIRATYAHNYWLRPWLPTIIIALGFGLMAAMHFTFAYGFLKSNRWSLLATILFITSMPVLTGSWIVAMGWQWVVNLSILSGLLCYQRYKYTNRPLRKLAEVSEIRHQAGAENRSVHGVHEDSSTALMPNFITSVESPKRSNKSSLLVLYILIAIVGSWFREYSGLFVFITLINELFFVDVRSWKFILVAFVCALHVMFPAFLANIIFWGKLQSIACLPVYKMGPIGKLSQAGAHLFDFAQLRFDALYHLISLFSPLLWIVAVISICLIKGSWQKHYLLTKSTTQKFIGIISLKYYHIFYSVFLGLSFILTCWALNHYDFGLIYIIATLSFYVLITLYVLPCNSLLFLYCLLSFLPFLKVYLHEVHLAYAVAPMSIVLVFLVRLLWDYIYTNYKNHYMQKFLKILMYVSFFIIISDAFCNVFANVSALRGMYQGIATRAQWLAKHTPKNSIVVGNFIDLRDMTLYAPGHFQPYFSLTNWELNEVATADKFIKMFDENSTHTAVYLLGAVFPRLPDKYNYHHLHYLAPLQKHATNSFMFLTRVVYPYFDPFKYFLSDNLTSFPGAPDLVDDYKVIKERSGKLFLREIFANYLLFQVKNINKSERTALRKLSASFVTEYKEYNIFKLPEKEVIFDKRAQKYKVKIEYVALAQQYGPMQLKALEQDINFNKCFIAKKCFFSSSIKEIKRKIDL